MNRIPRMCRARHDLWPPLLIGQTQVALSIERSLQTTHFLMNTCNLFDFLFLFEQRSKVLNFGYIMKTPVTRNFNVRNFPKSDPATAQNQPFRGRHFWYSTSPGVFQEEAFVQMCDEILAFTFCFTGIAAICLLRQCTMGFCYM